VARPPDRRRRQELLDAVIADCAAHGVGTRSLRELAASVGTSHRMLIHHFGSREELLVAVVEAVEARQRAFAAELAGDPADVLTAMWRTLTDPRLRPLERLFFECYARGANGEAPFDRLLPDAVESWLQGDDDDPAARRLGLAVVRGLLLDLVGTGDEAGTSAALSRFADLLRRQRPRHRSLQKK
jgi:AcrR family transcriptional regulator